MIPFLKLSTSSVGKKIITGLTGLGLCVFIVAHLAGNLSLLRNDGGESFNLYTKGLESLGGLLYVLEAGLILAFVLHALVGISIWLKKREARPVAYEMVGNAGGNSRKSWASRSMILTGLILLVFLVVHIKTFKFGAYYETAVNGLIVRDLYKLVVEKFSDPWYAFGYTLVMLLLGMHLRHGFWSAFQSLGVDHPRFKPLIYGFGVFFSIAMAVGFLALPLWIYFTH